MKITFLCLKEDSDEDDDDEEESYLNELERRAFVEEEHRRHEAYRQRLAHISSLAEDTRNDYITSSSSGNKNSQRHPLSKQTPFRGTRGGLRGKNQNYKKNITKA